MAESGILVNCVVEGIVDEVVLRRLFASAGAKTGSVYGKNGKPHLLQKLRGYNQAAQHGRWLVLVDLNGDADCAPPFRVRHLPDPARHMCFRVAVRAVEAWLLADMEEFAAFFGVAGSTIPQRPEQLENPKETVVQLARKSRRKDVREHLPPRLGSGRKVGPLYTSYLSEFAAQHWRPGMAARRSDSLRRCRQRLSELLGSPP
ncbi:MAG: hypothetical protein HYY96_17270 [Candidatus Tectomicrobia bacterium]|nr:hypothetical protein [Candidatus Tectomicrobia bacterium]